jgi:hypothetical protein
MFKYLVLERIYMWASSSHNQQLGCWGARGMGRLHAIGFQNPKQSAKIIPLPPQKGT